MISCGTVTQINIYAAAMLSYIAYTDEMGLKDQATEIAHFLKDLTAAANGPFHLRWGPINSLGVLAFVAQGLDGSYTLALRGTVTDDGAPGSWSNVIEDLDVTSLAAYPYPSSSNSNVAWGSLSALESLVGATDPTSGVTLIDFLRSTPATESSTLTLNVTGHSLGADLTNLVGPWLVDQYPRATVANNSLVITPYTFAAPTTTDGNFATLWSGIFKSGSYAAVNKYDLVPWAWTETGVTNIFASFSGGPQIQNISDWDPLNAEVWYPLSGIQAVLNTYDPWPYVPLTPSDPFSYAGWEPSLWGTSNPDLWPNVVEAEHSMSTYVLGVCGLLSETTDAPAIIKSRYGLPGLLMPSIPSSGEGDFTVSPPRTITSLTPPKDLVKNARVTRVSVLVDSDTIANWQALGPGWKSAMARYIPKTPS